MTCQTCKQMGFETPQDHLHVGVYRGTTRDLIASYTRSFTEPLVWIPNTPSMKGWAA